MKYLLPALAVLALVGQGCFAPEAPSAPTEQTNQPPMKTYTFPGVLPEEQTKVKVRMQTSKGDIVLEMLPEEGPNAASNFVSLVKEGFYDGLSFHRREEQFVIQGGDPLGNGTGGPGYKFADDAVRKENPQVKPFPENENLVLYTRGTLAMANAGANTNGSQFFVMLADQPLPPAYSIFGRVVEGMEVVDQIQAGDTMTSVRVE